MNIKLIFLIVFLLLICPQKIQAHIIFQKNGSIVNFLNSETKDKNMIVFLNDGSIKVLSTSNQEYSLEAYAPIDSKNLAILGLANDIESQELIRENGELRIFRNSDKSITLTIVDQKNPDIIFEHNSQAEEHKDHTLVYLDIKPAPITVSDEVDGLYISQDIFKIRLTDDFTSFIIRSTPDNISIATDSKEFKMITQPIDAAEILSKEDKFFSPEFLFEQRLVLNGQEPEYQINNQRIAGKIFNYNMNCSKTYSVLFSEKQLAQVRTSFLSRFFCLIPAK